jgi:hypothetical protein
MKILPSSSQLAIEFCPIRGIRRAIVANNFLVSNLCANTDKGSLLVATLAGTVVKQMSGDSRPIHNADHGGESPWAAFGLSAPDDREGIPTADASLLRRYLQQSDLTDEELGEVSFNLAHSSEWRHMLARLLDDPTRTANPES